MYDDSHRALLQMIMNVGMISEYNLHQAVGKIFGFEESASLKIASMNHNLESLDMTIKSGCDELTGEKYYALTSTVLDTVNKFQTHFTKGQLELLRSVYTKIIESPDGTISSTNSLNLCSSFANNISKTEAEEFLNIAVRDKWLNIKDGQYSMGIRSIMELMPYFRSNHPDGFNICPMCKQTIFYGRRCERCQAVTHLYCLATLAKVQNPLKCINCQNVLPSDDLPDVPEYRVDRNNEIGTSFQPDRKRYKTSRNSQTHN